MDDIEKLLRARQTILEMLQDRGYSIKDDLWIKSKDEFKKLFYAKNIDFLVEANSNGKPSVYVKWLIGQKIKPNFIKDTIDNLKEDIFQEKGSHNKIMIISKAKPNTNIQKILKEKEYRGNELFWLNSVIFNITKHILVPKHTLMNEVDVKKLLDELYITNKFHLPIMLKTDPIAKYFDLSTGDVCQITRFSPTSGYFVSYRVVR